MGLGIRKGTDDAQGLEQENEVRSITEMSKKIVACSYFDLKVVGFVFLMKQTLLTLRLLFHSPSSAAAT